MGCGCKGRPPVILNPKPEIKEETNGESETTETSDNSGSEQSE